MTVVYVYRKQVYTQALKALFGIAKVINSNLLPTPADDLQIL